MSETAIKEQVKKVTQKKNDTRKVKQGKRKPRQRRPKVNVPYLINTPVTIAADNSYAMAVETAIDLNSFKTMLFAIASYVLRTGMGSVSYRSLDMNYQTLWSGLDFMLQGMWTEIKSGTVTLSTRPRVIHDIIHALANKTITVRGGMLQYSWTEANMNPIASTTYGPVTYWAATAGGNVPMYNDTNNVAYNGIPSIDSYTTLIKYLDTLQNPFLRMVDSGAKSSCHRDVSSRSRSYSYCGLKPTASSGWALSVENEVPILRPNFAKFVAYNENYEDKRIPTQLCMESGDPCTMLGLIMSGLFGPLGTCYKNRCSPRFLPIDFEAFYDVLCLWMVQLKQAAWSSGASNDGDIAISPLPFTMQDFRIALMQALKGLYETSFFTQFVGPLQYNESGNQFIPAVSGGLNYANVEFARTFLLPTLLAENFNALKARSVMAPKRNGVGAHSAVYVPVLGRWYQDTPAEYRIPFGEGDTSLFTADPSQEAINILDGTMGSGPVNLNNGFYGLVIDNWNAHVSALKVYSSEVTPLVKDRGPLGLPLILATVSERSVTVTEELKAKSKPKMIADKYLINYAPVKKVDKNKQVTYIPAATTPDIDLLDTLTMLPNGDAELITLFDTLVLPSIRFNFNDPGDVLNSQMYQVHTRFINSLPVSSFSNVQTQTKYARWSKLASMCVTGIGKDSTDVYDSLMKTLTSEGKASGLLSILSGIVGAIIPPLAPVAAAVAGALDH